MSIKIGDTFPGGKIWEYVEEETPGCSIGPNEFNVEDMVKGKRIALFALPGAFTPTCSAKHLPGYVQKADQLREKVDEIWCLSVNDAFVMGAWGREHCWTGLPMNEAMMSTTSGFLNSESSSYVTNSSLREYTRLEFRCLLMARLRHRMRLSTATHWSAASA